MDQQRTLAVDRVTEKSIPSSKMRGKLSYGCKSKKKGKEEKILLLKNVLVSSNYVNHKFSNTLLLGIFYVRFFSIVH